MSNIKRIGWDADGVLVDSMDVARRAVERILGLFGITKATGSRQEYHDAFSVKVQESLVGAEHSATMRSVHRLLMRHMASETRLFSEVIDVVKCLPVPSCIVTAALAEGIKAALGEEAPLFVSVVGREMGRKSDLLASLATNSDVIYVTDSPRDVSYCRDFGIPVIAVTWGYHPPESIEASNPTYIVNNAAELKRVLLEVLSS